MDRLSESDRHRLLANERRRAVLDVLGGRTTDVGIEELATAVARREVAADEPGTAAEERVLISLYHRETGRVEPSR